MAKWRVASVPRDGTDEYGDHDVVAVAMRVTEGGALVFEQDGEILCAWGPTEWAHVRKVLG